jgi:glycosyltransferase involved in cell wall biosynthesis
MTTQMTTQMTTRPRIAIAHDYLTQRGGAERVVLALAERYPDAPIHTTLYDPEGTFPEFAHLDVRPSVLNSVPLLRHHHRLALPLLPWACESVQIDADVVIASSSGWAHGFGGRHRKLVYCHSPARWLYCGEQYLDSPGNAMRSAALRATATSLRRWDQQHARSADRYLVNSTVVRQRVASVYGIEADVVPAPLAGVFDSVAPEPVDDPFVEEGGYFLCVARLLPYKNVDRVVEALRLAPEMRLVVIGAGPERERLRATAPPNVHFLRDLTDGQMRTAYARCRALVAASFEDFGLTPLEAAGHGRPSVVLRAGGFLDTMVDGATAVFFDEPTPAAICRALRRSAARTWDTRALRAHARTFCQESFLERIDAHVHDLLRTAPVLAGAA